MNPAPDLLRVFLVVAHHRSFTRAAADLFISQPAVSRKIQQLERDFGISLFERMGKTVHLTAAGEFLQGEAEKMLGNLGRMVETVRAHAAPGVGRMRIGAGTTPGIYMLPAILGEFLRDRPAIELSYLIESSDRIVRGVTANEIDIGFVGAPVEANSIVSEPIAQDEVVCFASRHHPVAKPKRIDFRSLSNETWIMRPKGSATRALFDSWKATQDVQIGHSIELTCPEGIRALVAAGVGLSYVSVYGLRDMIRPRALVRLPVVGMKLRRTIYAIRHVDKRLTIVNKEFLATVRNVFRNPPMAIL